MNNPKLRAGLFFLRRIVWLILTFLVMTTIIFALMQTWASAPARMPISEQPIWRQYIQYLGGMLRGDFGPSMRAGQPVIEMIGRSLPSTLRLLGLAALAGMALSALIVLAGVLALGLRDRAPVPGAILQRLGQVGVALGMAAPAFVLGLYLLYLFALKLEWLPVGGWVELGAERGFSLRHALLPTLTLAILPAGLAARSVLGEIVHYRAGGGNRGLLALHAVLSFFQHGLIQAIGMLGGALLVEMVFSLPGIGRLLAQSIMTRDYFVVRGLANLFLLLALLLRAAADLAQGIDGFILPSLQAAAPEAKAPATAQVLRRVWIGICLLLVVVPFAQGISGFITGGDEIARLNAADRNLPPGSESTDGDVYAWGTDSLGRDIRARARYALGVNLGSSLLTALVALLLALPGGLLAGYLAQRGAVWADLVGDVVMFPVEALTALPGLILLAFILAVTGPGLGSLLIWLTLAFLLPRSMRMVRDWWMMAAPEKSLWLRLAGISLGVLVFGVGAAVVTQPVMGFLGLGIQPPQPDVGAILGEGMRFMRMSPQAVLRPARALLFAALGWFLLADALLSEFGLHTRKAWLELNR
ncbi:MAG: hypothetical protein B6I35_12130 [Anaerolineaceae bacterium 4572_32.2]|nr:MAG: hypothetical protein B6I35_12130 [Anaerolineaceae bacterium 4572_32.2]HEY71931.1 hypothetical protein [Thermoflexia bacterium]